MQDLAQRGGKGLRARRVVRVGKVPQHERPHAVVGERGRPGRKLGRSGIEPKLAREGRSAIPHGQRGRGQDPAGDAGPQRRAQGLPDVHRGRGEGEAVPLPCVPEHGLLRVGVQEMADEACHAPDLDPYPAGPGRVLVWERGDLRDGIGEIAKRLGEDRAGGDEGRHVRAPVPADVLGED